MASKQCAILKRFHVTHRDPQRIARSSGENRFELRQLLGQSCVHLLDPRRLDPRTCSLSLERSCLSLFEIFYRLSMPEPVIAKFKQPLNSQF